MATVNSAMSAEEITFSFGKNWGEFLDVLSESDIDLAVQDIRHWLGDVHGKTVVDVGSGSGINSLAFCRLGAKSVHSFDYDPLSVQATRKLKATKSGQNWTVERGSVLDDDYIESLGQFDIVYSWGVLHHTGSMWEAIEKCARLVKPGGLMWISLYAKGPLYQKHLALKKKFNASSQLGKRLMIGRKILRKMASAAKHGRNPLKWNHTVGRGMNEYHDIVDWLGGLPYETATADEVVQFTRRIGLVMERIRPTKEQDCSIYVMSRADARKQVT